MKVILFEQANCIDYVPESSEMATHRQLSQ